MEKLYKKITYPSGKVRYEETFQYWNGDPSDGIWYIKKEKSGRHYHWICKRLSDLPKAKKIAELEPYRNDILEILENQALSEYDVVTKIFELLAK